jgi:hypothetical protein
VLTRLLVCCAVLATSASVWAQTAPESEARAERPRASHARADRIYLGMWTSHLREDRRRGFMNNWGVGAAVKGYFGATFLNSYGGRAFTAGIQRTVASTPAARVNAFVGYRLGLLTGYDRRLIALAAKTPVLPFVQPFVCVDVDRVGVELSYTFVVLSIATSYKF